jgi:peroxiredoxin
MLEKGQKVDAISHLVEHGPVLLAFFKISCPVCQYTLPFLDRIRAGSGIQVIGVSQDSAEATERFQTAFGLHFPMVLDAAADGYPLSNAFRITHVPSVFLVETDQRISQAFAGFSRRDIEEAGSRAGVKVFREGERTPEFKPG